MARRPICRRAIPPSGESEVATTLGIETGGLLQGEHRTHRARSIRLIFHIIRCVMRSRLRPGIERGSRSSESQDIPFLIHAAIIDGASGSRCNQTLHCETCSLQRMLVDRRRHAGSRSSVRYRRGARFAFVVRDAGSAGEEPVGVGPLPAGGPQRHDGPRARSLVASMYRLRP